MTVLLRITKSPEEIGTITTQTDKKIIDFLLITLEVDNIHLDKDKIKTVKNEVHKTSR